MLIKRRARFWVILVCCLFLSSVAAPAGADFPWSKTGSTPSDPYNYWEYMKILPAQFPPTDLGDNIWKYSSKTACDLYGNPSENCRPTNNLDPQELLGVTGASIDKAWETTSGRPDVVLAVTDSGIRWNDSGAMGDLVNKTWLNSGELPEPDWGTRNPAHPYDRNDDGIFNMKDYCSDPSEQNNCAGVGDSRVRGAAGSSDTDYNANGWIDPEDLIFKFSDGVDDDGNGYKDDFVGWDTYEDDNDPYDEVQYDHGTGEARDSTAEVNNGGDAGVCPNCMVMHMRVGDSFIADVNDFAEAALYATDNGASIIQSALGTLNSSRLAQEAIDYAWRRGVVLIASAADESAGHHNQPSVLEHGVTFNSIGEPEVPGVNASYLQFRGCTNYGAYITAAVPSNQCSSEAVGRTAGMAGLIYSAARNGVATSTLQDYGVLDGPGGTPAGHGVSAEEIDQIISTTADDMNFITPVNKEAQVDLPETQRYPATEGWDPFFGYGRVNADRMVRAVSEDKIPPEADISTPRWFAIVDPDDAQVSIEGLVASRRSPKYSYSVKWALWSWRDTNAKPTYVTTGVTLTVSGDIPGTEVKTGQIATISSAAIKAAMEAPTGNGPIGSYSGPAVDPATGRGDHENRQIPDKFGVIVQLEVTAKDADGVALDDLDGDDLTGIGTKNFNFHDDPSLLPGFPIDLEGDGAAPPRYADLDNDGKDELILATSNGEIHAYKADGSEVPGWPVKTAALPLKTGADYYTSGEITVPSHAAVLRSPAVGDLNRDGDLEVISGDFEGYLWAWDRTGSVLPGFPVRSNPDYSAPKPDELAAGYYASRAGNPEFVPGDYPGPGALPNDPDIVPDLVNRRDKVNRTTRWFLPGPSLGDIAGDGMLEILAGAGDRHIYAVSYDGSPVAGWPVFLRDPAKLSGAPNDRVMPSTHRVKETTENDLQNAGQIINSPAIGDIDGDGDLEVVASANEQYLETPNTDDPLPNVTGQVLPPGNNRLYAVHNDGTLHGLGPGSPANGHPNVNAYLLGWPASIATLAVDLLPVVGEGPDGSAVIGNVNGGIDLEVGIFGTAGPAYILDKVGESIYGNGANGRDRTLLMEFATSGSNSTDTPTVPAVGGGIFSDLQGLGNLSFIAPSAGLGKLVDLALPEDQLLSDNHLSVWELQSGGREQLPAFPREVNDLHFLSTPSSADIDGLPGEEILDGSAYSDFHAFSVTGGEPGLNASLSPTAWPKFTGGWSVGAASVGDLDDDGMRDVSYTTREGNLFTWKANGADVCDPASWPQFGHDGWMTNNYHSDTERPDAITNFTATVTAGDVLLSWTAPGDDKTCGTADSYEIRYSSAPITAANFYAATPFGGVPDPAAPGTQQSFNFERQECDARYVAIRTWDADPEFDTAVKPANPSGLSNVLTVPGEPVASCFDLSINDVNVTEGDSGATNAVFTVTLSPASPQTVTVNFATANGTATAPADYTSVTGTVTFAPGTTTQTVNVSVQGDIVDESNESFFVNLSSPNNATISDPQGVGTVNDDDGPPSLSINDVTLTEGTSGATNAVFSVALLPASTQTVTVKFATANGTATAPADYASATGTLTFPPGATSKPVTITVVADALTEPNETFFVNLSSPTNANISDPQGVGTIKDDDPPCVYDEPSFPNDIARDVEMYDRCSGFILDGFGGVHPVGDAQAVEGLPYFPNFDIARELVLNRNQTGTVTGGFVLDGWGGMHPFRTANGAKPARIQGLPYFPGNDIARDVVLTGFNQTLGYHGGYLLDGRGGAHPFGGNAAVTGAPYFNIDIARELVLPDPAMGNSPGYILDGYGGMHPIKGAPALTGLPYFPGNDIANDALLTNEPNSGYMLDGYGGIHRFGAAPAVNASHPYTAGVDRYKAFDLSNSSAGVVLQGSGNLWDF